MSFDRFKPVNVGVNSTVRIHGSVVGGFIAVTSGTVQFILRKEGNVDVNLLPIPVTDGQVIDIPFFAGTVDRSTVVTAGGASGIVFYS